MKRIVLKDGWKFRMMSGELGLSDEIAENIPWDTWVDTKVPSSMMSTLLTGGYIPDPFYRDNELALLPLANGDCRYRVEFDVTDEMLSCDALLLHFDGIDTLGNIYVNAELVGETDNMHRTWEYDLTPYVQVGTNCLEVELHSPVRYIKAEQEKVYCGGVAEAMEGFPHLRKAHCMFGWDWGPRIPDCGIFREVSILYGDAARFDGVHVLQQHEDGKVLLDFDITLDIFENADSEGCECGCEAEFSVEAYATAPDGTCYLQDEDGVIEIDNPRLWWPNGYGEQPLYTVRVELTDGAGELLDVWEKRMGLRTMALNRDENAWGENFAHEVNGQLIFAMGADYIPEDNLLSRVTPERTRRLLEDAVLANHNVIRVWGGGYYPDDFFYDICDELGLLVWQDFMFSCASYELTPEFEKNITAEAVENLKRIRHHASLALMCGNNEMETQTLDKAWKPSKKQHCDYIKIFEYILPKVMKGYAPELPYWPSSPSAGGNYDNPWAENKGDTHCWDVWHGERPITEYRKHYFAYLSEFGFQSFPALRTVEQFTEPEDRNIFSRVMEMHQRNAMANGKIMRYMGDTYLYPKDFDHLLYASQLLQMDAIRYGVEHYRRHRGRCMGTIVWQLNDIWPVASWASIDYYGRWKALHYGEKRMFEPIHISCEEMGEQHARPACVAEPAPMEAWAKLHVANETAETFTGEVVWKLCDGTGAVLRAGNVEVTVPAFSGAWVSNIDVTKEELREVHLSYSLQKDEAEISRGSVLFVAPKHYRFADPKLQVRREDDTIVVTAEAYAKAVEISATDGDLLLSDNYFDMEPGEVRVKILRGDGEQLKVRSVVDIADVR